MVNRTRLLAALSAALVVAGSGSSRPAGAAPTSSAKSAPGAQLSVSSAEWRTDFTRHTVPLSEFQSGGPGKGGIPALFQPRFAPVPKTDYLQPDEPLIELVVKGQARAYPIQILIWHEIVNDTVAGTPVVVTFCPLCNTSIVFDRRLAGRTLSFNTTGNLRNSDLVMYDVQTESWWQQFGGEGVVGRFAGSHLRQLPARIVSWTEFKRTHPDGLVLTRDTGYSRTYGTNPYVGYDDVKTPPFFPTARLNDRRLAPKDRVVYIERKGQSVAIPLRVLAGGKTVRVTVGGHHLVVRSTGTASSPLSGVGIAGGPQVSSTEVLENGKLVAFDEPFWFAVAAFRPKVVLSR